MKRHRLKDRGFGMIEVVIGFTVLSVSLFSIAGFFQTALRASRATESAVQSDYLLEEGVEVLKSLRDSNYTNNFKNLSTTTTYYLAWNGTSWVSTTTKTIIDSKFERKYTLADGKRDANSDIVSSGTADVDLKLATVSVIWWSPVIGTTTRSIQAYITNLFLN